MNSTPITQTCAMCAGKIEDFSRHNCLKSLREALVLKSQELQTLEQDTTDATSSIFRELKELKTKVEGLEEQYKATNNVTEDLQYQIDEIKEVVERLKDLKIKDLTPAASQKSMDLEEGEVPSSSQSSSHPMSQGETATPTFAPDPEGRAKQMANKLASMMATQTPGPAPTRTIERCSGATIKLNSIRYEPARSQFKITTRRPPLNTENPPIDESSSSQEDFVITSNNINTQGRPPSDRVEIIIESADMPTMGLRLLKETSGAQLHKLVREKLKINPETPLRLMYAQHTIIAPDERSLWANGFRHTPNHIAVVPDDINRGDQVLLAYKGKGPNVNGGYIRLGQKPRGS